jgi:hypothetical protein
MGPQPPLRLVRAAVFSAVCGSLTLIAHVTASRMPVPAWAVMAGFAIALGVAAMLAGHERSLATILGGLLGGQFALHVLFTAAQPHAVVPMAHGQEAMLGQTAMLAEPIAENGTGMTLAHLAAAAVSAWWLWRGERSAWSLARRATALAVRSIRRLFALLGGGVPAAPRVQPYVARIPRPICAALRYSVVLRGPPCRSQVSSGALSA